MSQANAAARKRRAGGASLQEVPAQAPVAAASAGVPKAGLTLPQVISLVDKRLTTLETFMKETQSQTSGSVAASSSYTSDETESAINSLADEINAKFVMLAGEVENLKDIVLKLQSYTLEVNKTLYEERIQVLSDMGTSTDALPVANKDNIVFDLSEDGEDA
jgi:hypothetical protein